MALLANARRIPAAALEVRGADRLSIQTMKRMPAAVWVVAGVLLLAWPIGAAADNYRVDGAASQVTIRVGKAGVFSFVAGHTHQVVGPLESGEVEFDPDDPSRSRVQLTIAAAALQVSPKDEPEGDAPMVQETMDSDRVLDVQHYPRLSFQSTAVAVKSRRPTTLALVVDGLLTIRAVTRPVSVPVDVELAGGMLTATGRLTVKQTAYGIKPVSVAGVVAVKDALDITFRIVTRR
jgi:polyisoprenoid-binding protein YceI